MTMVTSVNGSREEKVNIQVTIMFQERKKFILKNTVSYDAQEIVVSSFLCMKRIHNFLTMMMTAPDGYFLSVFSKFF